MLEFLSDFLFHVFFNSPEHERLQDIVKSVQLLLVQLGLINRVRLNIFGKPLLKLLVRVKQLRHDEVHQSPEFCHRVLNGSAGQKKFVSAFEVQKSSPSLAVEVFNSLCFIENNVLPVNSTQNLLIKDCDLVRSYHKMKFGGLLSEVAFLEISP